MAKQKPTWKHRHSVMTYKLEILSDMRRHSANHDSEKIVEHPIGGDQAQETDCKGSV